MEVILLERIAKLGQMGDVVRVKDGYARNFLLPGGKALRATKDNRAKFETMKAQLEVRNAEEAERIARGEDVTARREEVEEQPEFAAEDFFEPEGTPEPTTEEPEADK